MAQLVTQLISTVPYFAQPIDPVTLEDIVQFDDYEDGDEVETVSLVRQHWALPVDAVNQSAAVTGLQSVKRKRQSNQFAVGMPIGTRGFIKPGRYFLYLFT